MTDFSTAQSFGRNKLSSQKSNTKVND